MHLLNFYLYVYVYNRFSTAAAAAYNLYNEISYGLKEQFLNLCFISSES